MLDLYAKAMCLSSCKTAINITASQTARVRVLCQSTDMQFSPADVLLKLFKVTYLVSAEINVILSHCSFTLAIKYLL